MITFYKGPPSEKSEKYTPGGRENLPTDWNPNLTKSCLFLWSVTDVALQGSDLEIGSPTYLRNNGSNAFKEQLAYLQSSSAQCRRFNVGESTFNQGSTVQNSAEPVTLKGNITHYESVRMPTPPPELCVGLALMGLVSVQTRQSPSSQVTNRVLTLQQERYML